MLPDEVTRFIGKVLSTSTLEVEKGAIQRFADAMGDPNPLYRDEDYARNSRYGSLIAPPGFFGWPTKWTGALPVLTKLSEEVGDVLAQAGYPRLLDGGIEFDFYCPVRAGDVLAASPKVINISERDTRSGYLVFLIIETTYINQKGDLVAKARQTCIYR